MRTSAGLRAPITSSRTWLAMAAIQQALTSSGRTWLQAPGAMARRVISARGSAASAGGRATLASMGSGSGWLRWMRALPMARPLALSRHSSTVAPGAVSAASGRAMAWARPGTWWP